MHHFCVCKHTYVYVYINSYTICMYNLYVGVCMYVNDLYDLYVCTYTHTSVICPDRFQCGLIYVRSSQLILTKTFFNCYCNLGIFNGLKASLCQIITRIPDMDIRATFFRRDNTFEPCFLDVTIHSSHVF